MWCVPSWRSIGSVASLTSVARAQRVTQGNRSAGGTETSRKPCRRCVGSSCPPSSKSSDTTTPGRQGWHMPEGYAEHDAGTHDGPGKHAGQPRQAFRYDLDIDMSSSSTQARVVRLVGRGRRVLELGCATGYMSRALRDRGCRVVGIEVDGWAAARAAAWCERVV